MLKLFKGESDKSIFGLYVIYDTKAQESGYVFTAINDDVAVRQVVNTLIESPYMNPDEYTLIQVGTYDKKECKIKICNKVVNFKYKWDTEKERIREVQADIQRRMFESAQGVKKDAK